MKPTELVLELNYFADNAELQTGEALAQLYFHYYDMFLQYCGDVPRFEIITPKGHVKLL